MKGDSAVQPEGPEENTPSGLRGVKNIIIVMSGKGGVGKSTVTVEIALTLRSMGKKVYIIYLNCLYAHIAVPCHRNLLNRRFPTSLAVPALGITEVCFRLVSWTLIFVAQVSRGCSESVIKGCIKVLLGELHGEPVDHNHV